MLQTYLSGLALGFAAFRLLLALALLGGLWLLWRKPRPGAALALVLGAHIACWLACRAPLQRPYALGIATDRAFNVGMAASTAAGNSAFEHTQAGFGSPEPLWNLAVAALAGFAPERAAAAYDVLTPLAILAVGLGVFFGLRRDGNESDAWERVMLAFAVLGLASLSMSPKPPTTALWLASFLLKPQHGLSFGLVAVALGLASAPRVRWAALGLVLGALAWVFLLNWAYLMPCLALGLLLKPTGERDWKGLGLGVLVSALVAAPYVRHLARDYAPQQSHGAAVHMWVDPMGLPLAVPTWSTLDLGPLLTLAVAGLVVLWRRRQARDRSLFATTTAAWGTWALSIPAALAGIAPEPDELHYFLRFSLALAAGAALAAAARHLEAAWGLAAGRGHLLALAACLPLSVPLWWDPLVMDRYYPESLTPLGSRVVAYADWIRAHTPADAVFVAGDSAASYIPALSGRRVLLNHAGKLKPRDYAERTAAERVILTSQDAELVRRTALAFGVSYVAIDVPLIAEYGAEHATDLARSAACRTVLQNAAVRLVEIAAAPPPTPATVLP